MRRSDSILGKILGFSAVSMISAILSLVVVPISTHVYDQAQLGIINFFFSVTTVLYSAFCLGLDQEYLRFYPMVGTGERRGLFTFNLVTCLFALVVMSSLALFFENQLSLFLFGEPRDDAILFMFAILSGMVVLRFISLFYRLNESILGYTISAGLISILQKGAYLVAAVYSRDYCSAITFVAFASVVSASIMLLINRGLIGRIDYSKHRPLYKKNLSFGFPLFWSAMIATLIPYIPQIVVRGEIGFSAVSVLTAASTVAMAINLIQSGFNAFWAPYVYSHYSDKQDEIQDMHEAVVIISVFSCSILALLSDCIFLIFNENYYAGSTLVPLLSLSPLCYTIGETTGVGINLKLKSGYIFAINFAVLVSCCVLSVLLIPIIGLAGAGIASGMSSLLGLLLKTAVGEKLYKCVRSKTFMLKGLIPYAAICAVSLLIPQLSLEKIIFELVIIAIMMFAFGKRRLLFLFNKLLGFVKG